MCDERKLSEDIRARAKDYTRESVNFQWIEAGVIIEWADRTAELENVRDTAIELLTEMQNERICDRYTLSIRKRELIAQVIGLLGGPPEEGVE